MRQWIKKLWCMCIYIYIHIYIYVYTQLEKEMETHSSSLAWRILWTEEPDGLQSIVSQRVGHDLATVTHTCIYNRILFSHKNRAMLPFLITWMDLKALCYVKLVRQRKILFCSVQFISVAQSYLTLFEPHGLQHPKLPCPSPTTRACSNSCPLSRWYHPAISSSIIPFSSCLQSFPASGSFPVSQFFTPGDQSIGVSISASVLPVNIQGWFPLGLRFDLLAIQGTVKSLLQHHSSKASILQCSEE